ncbi:MAG TPA: hypothetical protein ENG48_04375 [Candidatus Atribacteria bacterium]|nr:hypothetical protein [Candidatus Atribacteria bacterium]
MTILKFEQNLKEYATKGDVEGFLDNAIQLDYFVYFKVVGYDGLLKAVQILMDTNPKIWLVANRKGQVKIIEENNEDEREKDIDDPEIQNFCKKIVLHIERTEDRAMDED